MTDPLAKRKTARVVARVVFAVLLPLLALALLWPDVGWVPAVLVLLAGAGLAIAVDLHWQKLTPREEMIGREGVVAYPFRRNENGVCIGNVQIGTESWTATANEADARALAAGRKVEVTAIDGLVVHVRPAGGRR